MTLVSPSELARRANVKKQAVHQALIDGRIPFVPVGKKKKIDLDNTAVQLYIQDSPRQREKTPSEEKPTIEAKPQPPSEKKPEIPANPPPPSAMNGDNPHEIKNRANIADMRKKELHVEILQGNYIPREFIDSAIFRYIEKLHTTLERSASVFVNEVGQKILEAGEIMPEHIEKFTALVLEAIHNTKKAIMKEYESYEPKL